MCESKKLDEDQFVRFRQLVKDEEVDVNCIDDIGFTPLIWLCCYNQSDSLFACVHLILQRPDIQINQTNYDERNALMMLCWWSKSEKFLEVAQLLIVNGININQTDNRGDNALLRMCWSSKSDKIVEVAQLLIANGIDINQTDEEGRNATDLLTANSAVPKWRKQEILALLQHWTQLSSESNHRLQTSASASPSSASNVLQPRNLQIRKNQNKVQRKMRINFLIFQF